MVKKAIDFDIEICYTDDIEDPNGALVTYLGASLCLYYHSTS